MSQIVGIYKITSPNNKVYIGQSWNILNRWSDHKSLRVYKNKALTRIFNSLRKYGVDNHIFEIAHELPYDVKQEVLDRYEQFYIDQYRDCGFEMLNLKEGGSKGKHCQESIEKMRLKGKENREKLKSNPEEYQKWLDKQRNAKLGKKVSEETKKKMSEAKKGKSVDPELIKRQVATRIKNGTHKMSQETKDKISIANKGRSAWNKGMKGQMFGINLKKTILSNLENNTLNNN